MQRLLILDCSKGVSLQALWEAVGQLSDKKDCLTDKEREKVKLLLNQTIDRTKREWPEYKIPSEEMKMLEELLQTFVSLKTEKLALSSLGLGYGNPELVSFAGKWKIPVKILKEEDRTDIFALTLLTILRNCELPQENFLIEKNSQGKDERIGLALRLLLVREEIPKNRILVLESNMDDISGEQMGFLMERLFQAGVRDALYMPVYMKKNRPAYMLQVLVDEVLVDQVEDLIFSESTTIGIRRYYADRHVMERRIEKIGTDYGEIRIKVCRWKSIMRTYPEYEDVKTCAIKSGKSFRELYEFARKAGESSFTNV